MTIFQFKDGELRIYSGTTSELGVTPYYHSVLFLNSGFNAPVNRMLPAEMLVMDRGTFDSNARYKQGNDVDRMEPLPISFTVKGTDLTGTTKVLSALTGTSPLTFDGNAWRSTKGTSTISGASTPQFADTTKNTVDIEVLWDGDTSDLGYKWKEVYFPGDQVTINEGDDEITINANGLVYGDVTQTSSFSTGTSS